MVKVLRTARAQAAEIVQVYLGTFNAETNALPATEAARPLARRKRA
jgi:hypothetical protein